VDLEVVDMCHTEELVYYLQLHISFEVILKDLIAKRKVATIVVFGLMTTSYVGRKLKLAMWL
jgi:hypothetical protein